MIEKPRPVNLRLQEYLLDRAAFRDLHCNRCDDVGVLRVKMGEIGTLCLCNCTSGLNQKWELPCISSLAGNASSKVPWKEFHPGVSRGSMDRNETKRFIRERASWWREKVRVAEEFWKLTEFERKDEISNS